MTVEDARKITWMFDRLDNIERTLRTLKKSKEFLSNGVIQIGNEKIYNVPIDIEEAVFDLLVERFKAEYNKIIAEIEAM